MDDTPLMVSLIGLSILQDTKVAWILGIAESGMQSAYILDVAKPANDLITKMGSDEWYKGYKSILTLPSGEYMWKKGYPIKTFHSVILHKTNLYTVAKRMSGLTRPIYVFWLVRRSCDFLRQCMWKLVWHCWSLDCSCLKNFSCLVDVLVRMELMLISTSIDNKMRSMIRQVKYTYHIPKVCQTLFLVQCSNTLYIKYDSDWGFPMLIELQAISHISKYIAAQFGASIAHSRSL